MAGARSLCVGSWASMLALPLPLPLPHPPRQAYLARGLDKMAANCDELKGQVDAFKEVAPLAAAMRAPGMRPRHWEQLSAQVGPAGMRGLGASADVTASCTALHLPTKFGFRRPSICLLTWAAFQRAHCCFCAGWPAGVPGWRPVAVAGGGARPDDAPGNRHSSGRYRGQGVCD